MSIALWLFLSIQDGLAPPVLPRAPVPPVEEACPAAAAPTVRRLQLGGIRYCGRIDDEGVRRADALLRRDDTRLVITSVGGELEAPLALAELVLRNRLDVEVAGPCFSACASIVFVAGSRRIVSPTGVLGFHNTNSSAFVLASHIFAGRGDLDLTHLRRRSGEETGLYARRGIDPNLLYQPQIEIETICVARAGTIGSGEPVFNLTSRLDLWAPSLATLRAFGIEFSGNYPASLGEVQQRLDNYLGRSANRFRFSYGGPYLPGRVVFRRLHGIGPC